MIFSLPRGRWPSCRLRWFSRQYHTLVHSLNFFSVASSSSQALFPDKRFCSCVGHALTWNALFFWVVVPAYILVLDAICFIFVSTWSHWLNRWPESQQGLNKDTSIHNLTRNMSHVPKTIQVVVTLLHGGPQTGLTASVCVWRPSQRS